MSPSGSHSSRAPRRWPVELADPADLPGLARLGARAGASSWSRTALAEELSRADGTTWVARGPRGPIGLLMAREVVGELHVMDVAVDPGQRRRGIASALLAAALDEARARRLTAALLELRASNRSALRLYRRAGFVVVGSRPRYYPGGEDALLMTLTLTPEAPQLPSASHHDGLPIRADAEVLENLSEGPFSHRLRLLAPGWPGAEPGQFVMLSAGARTAAPRTDPLLPRPMAVYRGHGAGEPIEVLYRVTGRGTQLLAETLPGQRIRLVGPLGRPFPSVASGAPSVLVGGGTGIASLYELAARTAAAAPVTVILGARAASDLMGREDFAALDVDLQITTEDGSAGRHGRVTDALAPVLDGLGSAGAVTVFACGPTPMMRACADLAGARGARCVVSLENNMACGFGVCLGCAVPMSAGAYSLVCRDGPVYEAGAVRWEGLP